VQDILEYTWASEFRSDFETSIFRSTKRMLGLVELGLRIDIRAVHAIFQVLYSSSFSTDLEDSIKLNSADRL